MIKGFLLVTLGVKCKLKGWHYSNRSCSGRPPRSVNPRSASLRSAWSSWKRTIPLALFSKYLGWCVSGQSLAGRMLFQSPADRMSPSTVPYVRAKIFLHYSAEFADEILSRRGAQCAEKRGNLFFPSAFSASPREINHLSAKITSASPGPEKPGRVKADPGFPGQNCSGSLPPGGSAARPRPAPA